MVKKRSINSYKENLDQYAKEYISPTLPRTVDQKILSMVVNKAVSHMKGPDILEMGFGDGAWTNAIIKKFGKSHLVDGSLKLLEQAKKLYRDHLVTYHSFFEEFEPANKFDTVVCSYILEHVYEPVVVLKKSIEWVKPGGILLAIVPNATSLHRRLAVVMGLQKDYHELGEADHKIGHRRVYDAQKLEKDLRSAGFIIKKRFSMGYKPLPNALLTQLTDAQLKGIFELGDQLPEDERGVLAFECGLI